MVEEDNREEEYPEHHTACTGVVGIRAPDEPLILCVKEGTYSNLCGVVQSSVPHSVVLNFELVHSVYIWYL